MLNHSPLENQPSERHQSFLYSWIKCFLYSSWAGSSLKNYLYSKVTPSNLPSHGNIFPSSVPAWALLLMIYSGFQTAQKSCHSLPTLHLERKPRLREEVGHDQEAELPGPGSSLDSCPAACPTQGQPCIFKTTQSVLRN